MGRIAAGTRGEAAGSRGTGGRAVVMVGTVPGGVIGGMMGEGKLITYNSCRHLEDWT